MIKYLTKASLLTTLSVAYEADPGLWLNMIFDITRDYGPVNGLKV